MNEIYNNIIETLNRYNMPINTFINNLNDLNIIKSDYSNYICESNTILYNNYESLIHNLFHVSSNVYRKSNGIVLLDDSDDFICGIALNDGITDLYKNRCLNIVDDTFNTKCALNIENVYGKDIYKDYFNNDSKSFYINRGKLLLLSYMLDKSIDSNDTINLINSMYSDKILHLHI